MEASSQERPSEDAEQGTTVVGDPGDLGEQEQEPSGVEDGHGSRTPASAPDPSSQSGVPLREDREKGVKPGF